MPGQRSSGIRADGLCTLAGAVLTAEILDVKRILWDEEAGDDTSCDSIAWLQAPRGPAMDSSFRREGNIAFDCRHSIPIERTQRTLGSLGRP